jgi:hypothetical protein
MLLTAFHRLSCGCPDRAAFLLLFDTVGLLAVNSYNKTHVMLFIIILKSQSMVLHELWLRRRDYSMDHS